jgi:hypothetical protein
MWTISLEVRPAIYSARSKRSKLLTAFASPRPMLQSRVYSKKSSPNVRMHRHRKGWARAAIPLAQLIVTSCYLRLRGFGLCGQGPKGKSRSGAIRSSVVRQSVAH